MLRESFIAAVGVPTKPPDTGITKDAAIFVHEFQPVAAQRAVYKKSATPANCLAVSNDHVFAAQAGKAVVHVYNREKANQEAIVPFTERITAISLACSDAVLILGTAEGRTMLWELSTGRQVTTSQAHLQAVTAIAVDMSSVFFLSASRDSTIQVWSIPDLLSFANSSLQSLSPVRTFDSHRSEVTALALGHSVSSTNFAVSTAKDRTCLVWNYQKNIVLRTFLLSGIPTCLALDPADRAAYTGYEDGNMQILDLLSSPTGVLDAVQNGRDSTAPIQPGPTTKWTTPDNSYGPMRSISIAMDGTTIISGHDSGSILSWDVGRKSFRSAQTTSPHPGPVTNVHFLPVVGFQMPAPAGLHIGIPEIVKPRFGALDSPSSGTVPGNYAMNITFPGWLDHNERSNSRMLFENALFASSFPPDLLDEGLNELATWGKASAQPYNAPADDQHSADYMSLDEKPQDSSESSVKEENSNLRMQLEALRRVQKATFEKMESLTQERDAMLKRAQRRLVNGSGKSLDNTSLQAESDDSSDS